MSEKKYDKWDVLGYSLFGIFIGFVVGFIVTGTAYNSWESWEEEPTVEAYRDKEGWDRARVIKSIEKWPCNRYDENNSCTIYVVEITEGTHSGHVKTYAHKFPERIYDQLGNVLVKVNQYGDISNMRFDNQVIP